ncbi:MAG: hypothetical protein J0L84_02870 [Verrucomicrobia bacterium]|nr:hypothetical protein [Verrucomicrobiota bacterium]
MTWKHSLTWLAALLLIGLLGAGCGESDKDPDADKPFTLSGASKVVDALSKKDYETTVAGLAEVKGSVTEKTQPEYRRLRQKVLDQLVMEMGDSEPAKEAYRAIAMMETGR